MGLFNRNSINYDQLVSILKAGSDTELQSLLWQPARGQVAYLPATTGMLLKLRQSGPSGGKLSIDQTIDKGHYQLVIFNTPGENDDLPYSPLVLHKKSGKVVGVMLPFNELHGHLSKRSNAAIGDLGAQWVKFTLMHRLKKTQ